MALVRRCARGAGTPASAGLLRVTLLGKTGLDVTPTDEDQIIARLRLDAKAGNVQAARELREWLRAQRERAQGAESIDTATSYAQLSGGQRLELRARLLGEALRVMGVQADSKPTWRAVDDRGHHVRLPKDWARAGLLRVTLECE